MCKLQIVLLITGICVLNSAKASVTVSAKLYTDRAIHVTDKRFLSVVMGPTVIRHNWGTFNVSSPKVRTMAMGLAPAIFRVGGSEADLLIFNKSAKSESEVPWYGNVDDPFYDFSDYGYEDFLDYEYRHDSLKNFTMSAEQWDTLNKFTRDVGWNLLFDLNVLLRRDGEWDSSNALELLKYSIEKNYTSNLNFELGNEPNAFKHYINRTVDPTQLGKDFLQLHYILRQNPSFKDYFANSLLVGPDTTRPSKQKSFKSCWRLTICDNLASLLHRW